MNEMSMKSCLVSILRIVPTLEMHI